MELNLQAPYEPLILNIGNAEVVATIDLTPDNLIDLSEACKKASGAAKAAGKLAEDAERNHDAAKMKEAYAKIAKAIEHPIVTGIGQGAYDEIRSACGGGEPISKAKCNLVMMQVFMAIYEKVKEARGSEKLEGKAAHYLSEVEDAQPEPDEDE